MVGVYSVKIFKMISLLIIVCSFSGVTAFAENQGFDTAPLPTDVVLKDYESINLRKNDEAAKIGGPIISFDVSDNNWVAFGTAENIIQILDPDGNTANTLEFDLHGSYHIEWFGKNLLLYLNRELLEMEITTEGELIDVREIDESSIKSQQYWRFLSKRKEKTINNMTYQLQNDMGVLNLVAAGRYNQLIKTDNEGNTTILYDVNTSRLIKMIIIIIFFIAFFTAVIILVFKKVLAMRK